ncbi:MAG: GNAT family N-acetyltransferase [Ginsengibacter sp.]
MDEVKFSLNEKGKGQFYIPGDQGKVAEMMISISGNDLTVIHTEVLPKEEGRGLATRLLAAMVDYARGNHLKVIALCPFVHIQFKQHPEQYNDIWKK